MRHQLRQQRWEEKREYAFIGPLIGGLILIVLGSLFYLAVTTSLNWQVGEAVFLIFVGLIVLVAAVFTFNIRKSRMREQTKPFSFEQGANDPLDVPIIQRHYFV